MTTIVQHLLETPYIVSLARCDLDSNGNAGRSAIKELSEAWVTPCIKAGARIFRAVEISRLPVVMRTGIDVEPTDQVFYADAFDKCMEYGGSPKLVLALDNHLLSKTYREVPADTAEDEIATIRKTYPTMLKSQDGKSLWLSRLKETDPRVASPYEVEYAWWIEREPLSTLKGLLVLFDTSDAESLAQFRNSLVRD